MTLTHVYIKALEGALAPYLQSRVWLEQLGYPEPEEIRLVRLSLTRQLLYWRSFPNIP